MTVNKNSSATKTKLDDLKALLQADPIKIDIDSMTPDMDKFPVSQNMRVVDHAANKILYEAYATDNIDSIILNYITSEKVLNGDKLKNVRRQHITKLAELQFLVKNSENNTITLQEAIDGGDLSKELFDTVKSFMAEMRANIEARSKHLDKCEMYWEVYAERYGLENAEEKVIQETEVKPTEEKKHIVTDMKSMNDAIQAKMDDIKKQASEKRIADTTKKKRKR